MRKKKSHHGKADIIRANRIKPERAMIKDEPELKYSVQSVPRKRAVERHIYAQPRILLPKTRVFVFVFKIFKKLYEPWDPKAPYRQRISRQGV
jgi:hypothetical protein